MSILPDVLLFPDISAWNENTQTLDSIDPNTLPATPPHTHLEQSQNDIMNTWDETPDGAAEVGWGGNTATVDDAAIAADIQANEFAKMDLNGAGGERSDRPPRERRAREYGTYNPITSLLYPHLIP
jgi:hypothetical protein